ncbi:MAG: zinc-binding dehydrogenase [Candidatus Dadabacteria bacterium]|nr:zinc-binding dehydrogenase [Candidatus Dadabacteria bacterium]MCY4042635.1 zinc-binding dehydrogenase [Candidatus Dadabacteria bacterium]
MKAGIYHEVGDADVIKYEDAEVPSPGADDVLIRVKACAMNSLDTRLRSGKSPRPVDLPHIGGIDISGEVKEAGKSVWGVFPGDRVVVNPAVKTGGGVSVIGVNRQGGFAEFVTVPAVNVCKIPDALSHDDACTLPICYVTALYGLVGRGGLEKGETVVVHAAGSGSGTAAIQVAKHLGAKVIATAGSDEKLGKARELGADETVNYRTEDFSRVIKGGVDVVFDPVGAAHWEKNIKILKSGGRLLLVGVVGGGVVDKFSIGPVIMRDISAIGVTVFNAPHSMLKECVEMAAGGTVTPVIGRKFPLSDLAGAHKALESAGQFGKVVVNP